jgi:hypothetical protein
MRTPPQRQRHTLNDSGTFREGILGKTIPEIAWQFPADGSFPPDWRDTSHLTHESVARG